VDFFPNSQSAKVLPILLKCQIVINFITFTADQQLDNLI